MQVRSWWENVAATPDADILAIDALEDSLAPLTEATRQVRLLISTLELCHHKAERRVNIIVHAVGAGKTDKLIGQRPRGVLHPVEVQWRRIYESLAAWRDGRDSGIPETQPLLSRLGSPTPLNWWQVQRIEEKILSFCDRSVHYHDMESACPTPDGHAHWDATRATTIHDHVDCEPAEISLAVAIDHLEPCHWNFTHNLEIVLEAIGGKLEPTVPFAACGRNMSLVPWRGRIVTVATTLRHFCELGAGTAPADIDETILRTLEPSTATKRWLALSLEKTLRSQLRL